MTVINDVVQPVFDQMGLHYLREANADNIVVVEFLLDQESGRSSRVTVIADDEHHDLKLLADACRVPAARTTEVLRRLNLLNCSRRWTRWLLAPGDIVLVDMDVELTTSSDPRGHFGFAFTLLVSELDRHWRSIAHAASPRRRRSKLERELAAIVDGFDARPHDGPEY